jgi:hypothetical protein
VADQRADYLLSLGSMSQLTGTLNELAKGGFIL